MWSKLKSLKLTTWIFISIIVGVVIGEFLPVLVPYVKPLRTLFLNAIKCIVAPLIFASIVTGINSAGSGKALGRTGLRAIVYFEIATTAALFIGLGFVNLLRPGDGVTLAQQVSDVISKVQSTPMTFSGFVEHLLPTNFAEAIVKGDVLQIVLFSTLFGIAVMLSGAKGKPVLAFCEGLTDVMFKFTDVVMTLAPLGVGAALAASIAENGWGVMVPMLKMVGTLYLALIVFVLIVLVPALKYARVNLKAFFKELRPTIILAFATASSESAYPQALESLEKMGVAKRIASFVLPLGYSFNLDGSTLYLAVASVFIAQAASIEISFATQIMMMLTLMLTTKGVAAVPRASLVVLSGTALAFGLPLEGITLILGVDAFMDMARTSVNLLGNCVATTVVARWEREPMSPEYMAG
ncbi:MAG: dicarboxylate/amino acid:cation symporter [Bdellovibrionales bacterium]|nr:dicarboxylate/amino acid:cation symporter [Bdellovibrionales bacterium]